MKKKSNNDETRNIDGVKVVNNKIIKNLEHSIDRIEGRETGAILSQLRKTYKVRFRNITILKRSFDYDNVDAITPLLKTQKDVTFKEVLLSLCGHLKKRFKVGKYRINEIDIDKQFRDFELKKLNDLQNKIDKM